MKDVGRRENVKVLHVNIRSLRKNWDLLIRKIGETKVKWEMIILTEINIKKEEVELYSMEKYKKNCNYKGKY